MMMIRNLHSGTKILGWLLLLITFTSFIDRQAVTKQLSWCLDRVVKEIEKLMRVYNAIDCPDASLFTTKNKKKQNVIYL